MPTIPSRRAHRSCAAAALVVALVAAVSMAPNRAADEAAKSTSEGINNVKQRVESLEATLAEGRPKRVATDFTAVADSLAAILAEPRPPAGARVLQDRLRKLKDSLELEGIDVSDLSVPVAKPAAKERPTLKPSAMAAKDDQPGFTRPPTPVGPGVSFSRDVAPMLVRSCGGCHVRGRKGNFQMASFDALKKSGMVQAGSAQASRLVEVIQSGDMPRGGGGVPPHDMAMLMKWIDAGAGFDGADPTAPLESLAAAGPAAANAGPPQPAKPTTPVAAARPPANGVSFAFDIAPVLLESCGGCHGGRRPRADLRIESHESLLRGGESGEAIVPGKGADSLIIRKLTGMNIDGQRMPLGKSALPDDVIAKIKRWIDEGAALDMLMPSTTLENLAAAGRAAKLSHEDLRDVRFAAGPKFWARAIPDESGEAVRRDDVLVIGNLPGEELAVVADKAQAIADRLREDLGFPAGQPLTKGSCVLCACRKSYDYASFWQTILSMERPKDFACHSGLSGDVLYGVFLAPKEGLDAAEADVTAMLAEQLATAAWLSRGAPEWFAVGAGRLTAARIAPKAPRVLSWTATKNRPSPPPAEAFLGRDIDPDDRARVAAHFVASLAGRDKLAAMARALGERADGGFDAAFAGVFGGSPDAAYRGWAGK
jgi:hypothetical protein